MNFRLIGTVLLLASFSFAAYSGTPKTPSKVDGCYQIGSAEELYGFAELMNTSTESQESTTCAKLTADIVVNSNVLKNDTLNNSRTDLIPWTPIVSYSGAFDGQGHKISGLYYKNDKAHGRAGFFLSVAGESEDKHAYIKNLGIADSYFFGEMYTGAFVGFAQKLNLENVYSNSVVSGTTGVGGLIGLSSQNINILNSYNEGNIYGVYKEGTLGGSMYLGGLVGYIHTSKNLIRNCYNLGNVSGSNYVAGLVGIVGMNTEFLLENSFNANLYRTTLIGYFDNTSTSKVVNSYTIATNSSNTQKTAEEFANGNVAIALHYSAYGNVWGQVVGQDSFPTLIGKISNYAGTLKTSKVTLYTYDGDTTQYFTQYAEGVGAELPRITRQGYLFAGWFDNSLYTGNPVERISASSTGDKSFYAKWQKPLPPKDGCYEITSADELFLFAARVNGDDGMDADPSACGKLLNDIVVNTDVLNSDYSLNTKGSFKEWTPLKNYKGHFDGQGHSISGLYIDSKDKDQQSFIGNLAGGSAEAPVIIENLGIVKSFIRGHDDIGAIAGKVYGYAIIRNSYADSYIRGETFVGGLVGYEQGQLKLINVYSSGSVYGYQCVGGLQGGSSGGGRTTIINSFSYGSIGGNATAPLFSYAKNKKDSSVIILNSYYTTHSSSEFGGTAATIESMSNGAVVKALHEYNENGIDGSVWGQEIGKDLHPTLNTKYTDPGIKVSKATFHLNNQHDSVYSINYIEGLNIAISTPTEGNWIFKGWFENSKLEGKRVYPINSSTRGDKHYYADWFKVSAPKKKDGCYQISSADELYGFAKIVNGTFSGKEKDSTACGVLTQDIKFYPNVLNNDGSLSNKASDYIIWDPIRNFSGIFDGQGHTISGVYLKTSHVIGGGLFTNIIGSNNNDEVAIKNLGITNSFFSDGGNSAAIAGRVDGKVSIENCFSTSTIHGTGATAGLVGLVYTQSELTIKNAFNAGVINGWMNKEMGGLIGWINPDAKASIYNSYNLDTLSSGLGNLLNANYDTSYTIEHSYYISFDTNADTTTKKGTGATLIQFANGSIAKALHDYNENGIDGSIWGQRVGIDLYPVHTGKIDTVKIASSSSSKTTSSSSSPKASSSASTSSSAKSSSSGKSSSSKAKSSSSKKTSILSAIPVQETAKVYSQGRNIFVEQYNGLVTIFDLNGNLVRDAYSNGHTEIRLQRAGTYIVRIGAKSRRISLTTSN